ncbi:hypothetical protein [Aphanothece sacrum]|uniref:DUF2157 domain-containing protein n=1 Tax=Aphanothece sacrum FPU1 TaxID=1920663 RepID=A0A401ID15_APHSA|nr:hypothetical protein [Aphanothece sacrum]GBF79124.1 hypothetical protein AsFPU1_0516 [Aphanothece sacrum FPU1]GBF86513.1 hypothetical protein AsFPU3_3584 [Aphanothece sacrum FPU3]
MPFQPDDFPLTPQNRLIRLQISITSLPQLLEGWETWLQLGLLTDVELQTNLTTEHPQFHLQLQSSINPSNLIQGLQTWQDLEIINQNTDISLEIKVNSSHESLLIGLDAWLQLELLTDNQINKISQNYLTCTISSPVITPQTTREWREERIQPPTRQRSVSRIGQMMQSLMAELSVIWLLLLGIFMVVISSGVIAANNWQNVPILGQYAILWLYTLGFWAASVWTNKQPHLRLTSQALRLVTLLLVTVNFWAMDSFYLWHTPLGWLIMSIAALSLSFLTIKLFKNASSGWPLINHLGLSYIHWGWTIPGMPLIATYAGVIGTTLITLTVPQPTLETENRLDRLPFSLTGAIVVYAVAILLIRAIFVTPVGISQLGLAVGICGWLMLWRFPFYQGIWSRVGTILLGLGWLLSVVKIPLQAIAVSGLAILYLSRRLRQYRLKKDWLLIFVIGLQLQWLFLRLSPLQNIITSIITITDTQSISWTWLSILLLPYLFVHIALINLFSRLGKGSLANFSGQIIALFGIILTALSLVHPLLRTVNLAISTVALVWVTQSSIKRSQELPRNPPSKGRNIHTTGNITPLQTGNVNSLQTDNIDSLQTNNIAPLQTNNIAPLLKGGWGDQQLSNLLGYLTHITGLLSLFSLINLAVPSLDLSVWATILLALMAVEGIFSLKESPDSFWLTVGSKSAWLICLVLGAMAYYLLWFNRFNSPVLALIWLIYPLVFTLIGIKDLKRRILGNWLSVLGLIMMQGLTLFSPETRLIGLGIATVFLFINTKYLSHCLSAAIAIGFTLSLVGTGLKVWQFSITQGLLFPVTIIMILWLLWGKLNTKTNSLAKVYTYAIDGWAITLSSIALVTLTVHSLIVYWGFIDGSQGAIFSLFLLLAMITYRSWNHPTNWSVYAIGWSLELLTVEVLGLTGRSIIALGIANIILGLLTQLLGQWWSKRTQQTNILSSWHILPLLYGGLGTALRWNIWENWTGFSSLGLVLIILGVGRRKQQFKPLLYVAIAGFSLSLYELLLYQVDSLSLGDRFLAMTTLATTIMYGYRLASSWLTDYLNFTTEELNWVAHIHWCLGSLFLGLGTLYPIEVNSWAGLGAGFFLTRYALMQGRYPHPHEVWVYLGILEGSAIAVYSSSLVPTPPFLSHLFEESTGILISLSSLVVYGLPWEQWGWPVRPWRVFAYLLPLGGILTALSPINEITWLVGAICYGILGKLGQNRRLWYLSLLLVDGAIAYRLRYFSVIIPFLYFCLVGLSLLIIVRIEPACDGINSNILRHYLRLLGTGLICFSSLLFYSKTGIIPGFLSLISIFVGLSFQVRAFLFVGTMTFLINGFYQLVILSFMYPLLKWIIGLCLGLIFIWIAASFESRKTQFTRLFYQWINHFETWD